MKLRKIAGIAMAIAVVGWGCNQGGTGEQGNNGDDQSPQEEQERMPDQSETYTDPMQQSQAAEISDEELKDFASVVQQVQIINQETQQEMIGVVEEEGLNAERFNEIQQTQQAPEQESNATNEEMAKFEAANRELEKIQGQALQKVQEKITDAGMTMTRYEEIGMSLQTDPDLQAKFQMLQQQNN